MYSSLMTLAVEDIGKCLITWNALSAVVVVVLLLLLLFSPTKRGSCSDRSLDSS